MFTVSMQNCPPARAAVMDYSSLLWTLAADAWVFHHLPSSLSLAGAGIIVGSSFTSMWLSHLHHQKRLKQLAAGAMGAGGGAGNNGADGQAVQLSKLKQYGEHGSLPSGGRRVDVTVDATGAGEEACGLLVGEEEEGGGEEAEGLLRVVHVPNPEQQERWRQEQGRQQQEGEGEGGECADWKLGTELEEVAAGKIAPTRTSTEKEALLQRSGR